MPPKLTADRVSTGQPHNAAAAFSFGEVGCGPSVNLGGLTGMVALVEAIEKGRIAFMSAGLSGRAVPRHRRS